MGFYNQRCPNCGKAVSKDAEFCNACGCPTATSWSNCHRCGSAVGADSKFCWKCGTEQDPAKRKQFYGDRWQRSPDDFAVRVELKTPAATLHHGLQVDEGTVALIFQNGKFNGLLEAGYHSFDNFFSRLLGFDKGKEAHAVLIDTRAAEVDFMLEDIRLKNQIPVDARMRLLFQVRDPKLFAERVLDGAGDFHTADLTNRFLGEVRAAVQATAQERTLDEVLLAATARELLERDLVARLEPALAPFGIAIEGVRLAEFGGPAVSEMRAKLGEIDRLNRELDANRRLQDAMRAGKVDAYRDEQQLKDTYDRITHEFGLNAVAREQDRQRFVQVMEQQTQVEGIRLDYEARRAEITNRLDEQKLRHQSEIADAMHGVELRKVEFTEDMRQQRERFGTAQEQQVVQAKTDLEVAKQGIEALKLVKSAKLEGKKAEDEHEMAMEAQRLQLRGSASMQALVATLDGEKADRILKLAELEMRKGLSVEQAMAMVAEKSPEIAPAIAAAMRAKYAQGPADEPATKES
jgi:RNA polymerase subunit RPABC4/transcription elongation factor Spt4